MKFVSLCLLILIIDHQCHSLRFRKMFVPTPMFVGDSATLDCQWTLGDGELLYSVKWYFDSKEFYRWVPGKNYKIQVFPIEEAFHIDENKSGEGRVRIQNVTLLATGILTCEISTDGPFFATISNQVSLNVIGVCNGLEATHHYKFKYFSSFKTEIPEVGNQASGVSMKAILDVYLENNDGIATFKISNLTTVKFTEDLGCERETEFPDERFRPPEDQEFARALEQPFRANLRGSQPFAIEFEETEHRWLSNFRKGIGSMFRNEILRGNFETQEEDTVASLVHQGQLVKSFSVEEETIFGICKVKYQINQIHDGFFTSENDLLPTRDGDFKEDLWQVDRFIDFDNCREKVSFHIHTLNEKRNKEKKSKVTRSSTSKFVLRGSAGHFDLYSALAEGITSFPLSLFSDEEAHSTATQKLVLIEKATNEELPTFGTNLKRSATWMHEVWSPFQLPKGSKPLPWIVYSEDNVFNKEIEVYGAPSSTPKQLSAMKVYVVEAIKTASNILTDLGHETNESQWREVTESLHKVSYILRVLNKKDILKIFDHIFETNIKIEKKLLIDTAASSGSHNAMEILMDYILANKIEVFQIKEIFEALTTSSDGTLNISRVMDYALNLDFSEREEAPSVLLNFAHYLSEFCIHKAHNYIPIKEPFREDCLLIKQRFIPHLKEIIYNKNLTWERTLAVKVLEVLRTYFSFEILSPIIDGRVHCPYQLKAMALRALRNWAPESDREKSLFRNPVMDLLKDVYTDVEQDFTVRAAALGSFISWQPSATFWNNLAQSTWHEPSKDFSSFTSSIIKLYAEKKVPALEKQWQHASSAFRFAKTPLKSEEYIIGHIFNFLFKNYANLLSLNVQGIDGQAAENFVTEIFSKTDGLSLFKYEYDLLAEEHGFNFNESAIPKKTSYLIHAKEFFDSFKKEINLENHPIFDDLLHFGFILQILENAFSYWSRSYTDGHFIPVKDSKNYNLSYLGRYVNLFEKWDVHPNELGLPVFTFSNLPAAFSFTTSETLPENSEISVQRQLLLKVSATHKSGVAVYLPWSSEYFMSSDQSFLELTLPVEMSYEGTIRRGRYPSTYKYSLKIVYDKKFPALRLSRTPMAIYLNPHEASLGKFESIKKLEMKEKTISKVDPFTGVKYDLVLKADAATSLGLQDFLKFPKIPFRTWSLDLFLNPEESETKKLSYQTTYGLLRVFEEERKESSNSNQEDSNLNISVTDTMVERFDKLIRFIDASLLYTDCKFIFHGDQNRIYEVFFADTAEPEKSSKTFYGFRRSEIPGISSQPASICFDLRNEFPSSVEEEFAFISKTNISQEVKLKVFFNCSQEIFKANALYSMSEEGRAETTGNCNSNYDNRGFNEKFKLFYDNVDIDASFEQKIESDQLIVVKTFLHTLRNWINLPSIKSLTQEIPERKIGLKIHRNVYHKNWDIHQKTATGDVFLTTVPDSNSFKYLIEVTKSSLKFIFGGFRSERFSSEKCILQANSVTTFSGVHYSHEPSSCWTLVFLSKTEQYYNAENNVLFMRSPQGSSKVPDIKYILFHKRTEIDFSNNELKVDGEVVDRITEDAPDLKIIKEDLIYKKGNHYFIYPYETVRYPAVIIGTDKIVIYNEFAQRPAHGICGSADWNADPEFVGPKHCVYKDVQLFTASWTGQSENCDAATLEDYRKGVDDFQAKCERYNYQGKEVHLNPRCLFFGWKVLTLDEHNYCVTAKPLPFCLDTCQKSKHQKVQVTFKCWPKEIAPDSLRSLIENDVKITTDPIWNDPFFYQSSEVEIATLCKQF